MTVRAPTGQALMQASNPQAVSTEGFDPSRIAERIKEIDPTILAPIVKKAADEFYDAVMGSAEDYLRENLDWNITSHLRMLERENKRMRTELWEVDRALGCMSLGHDTRINAIKETQQKFNQASAEAWRLRAELESAIEARSGETGTGSTEGESASDAQTPQDTANDRH